ncbi:2-oxo acid dehydrogenase subunit E2 [Nitriliruptor alkaliphilus]|uniref:2-oxo acid dehydrogenase subunit E2 n=1 Tax=Nitriliruptor alkaliphilus TaxID=427918 RepID=UPI0006968FE4|nr:2-oxo acid dehydrogenase subunit E2 [Nitriliruptor alkaliphilus]
MGRQHNSVRRKLAIATWRPPREANIYGKLELDATEALAYLQQVRERSGERVTMTHLVARATAAALAEEPTLNGRIRFGRYLPNDRVSIAFLVTMPDGSDLARARVDDVDRKDLATIAAELRSRSRRLRDGADTDWEASKRIVRVLPTWLLRPLVWTTGWLTASLGIDAKPLGLERQPFGSAIVTSVGMLGLDEAWVPPTPFARVPLYVLIGAVRERPTTVEGQVVSRPMLTVTATIDHRFIDGFQAATLARAFRRVFDDPWSLDRAGGAPSVRASGGAQDPPLAPPSA